MVVGGLWSWLCVCLFVCIERQCELKGRCCICIFYCSESIKRSETFPIRCHILTFCRSIQLARYPLASLVDTKVHVTLVKWRLVTGVANADLRPATSSVYIAGTLEPRAFQTWISDENGVLKKS